MRLRALQFTVSDVKKRDPAGRVVIRPRPSGLKFSIGVLCPMQNVPACTALSNPTAHCPHRHIFQVIFGNRDGGELGGFPLQYLLLIVYRCHTKPLINPHTYPAVVLMLSHNPMQPRLTARSNASAEWVIRAIDEVDSLA